MLRLCGTSSETPCTKTPHEKGGRSGRRFVVQRTRRARPITTHLLALKFRLALAPESSVLTGAEVRVALPHRVLDDRVDVLGIAPLRLPDGRRSAARTWASSFWSPCPAGRSPSTGSWSRFRKNPVSSAAPHYRRAGLPADCGSPRDSAEHRLDPHEGQNRAGETASAVRLQDQ